MFLGKSLTCPDSETWHIGCISMEGIMWFQRSRHLRVKSAFFRSDFV